VRTTRADESHLVFASAAGRAGATVKVLARYERAFWRTRGMSGEYISTRGPVSMAIDNTGHDGAHPALLCFVVGRDAFGWSSRDRRTRQGEVLAQLVRAFGDEARHPVAILEQDWAEEPYTRGCPVGNMGFGLLSAAGHTLAAPVGRVHWAGTETATEWTGYMEGAVASGERAAREVIAALAGDAR
jgi:monoamine oxidase